MTDGKRVRGWYAVHTWSSLVCTVFLLVLCVSGLPLIFADEIDGWLEGEAAMAKPATTTAAATLDHQVAASLLRYPGEVVRWIVFDKDANPVVTLAPSRAAAASLNHWLKFSPGTEQLLGESVSPGEKSKNPAVMKWVLRLHTDLFSGLAGEIFLGVMGLLFVLATLSGAVLYGRFMRKLRFGTVRTARTSRLRWLDLHNLLGIVTLVWACVVGLTGVINELSTPLFGLWRATELKTMLAPHQNKPAVRQLPPVQNAVDTARRTLPGHTIFSVVYPDEAMGNPHHFLVWARGGSALTSRLFTPLLIDAQTAELTAIAHLPWYLKALEISRPLHFGDYGGLPLKIIWALLDLMAIAVLGSGLYLWFARRKATEARMEKLAQGSRT